MAPLDSASRCRTRAALAKRRQSPREPAIPPRRFNPRSSRPPAGCFFFASRFLSAAF